MSTYSSLIQKLTIAVLLFSSFLCFSQTIDQEITQFLEIQYPSNQPGATAIVTKNGKAIYRKAFGMANLELGVPMSPENVFEIGSITKQFTAVSILMLMEEGKLSLSDEITKYLPDYPTHGHSITIHHLLNHTSGIKSYTSMSSFISQARTDMKPKELIDVFKNEQMDFEPGEKYLYNNSAYIILGYIIEEVSGDTYENFVEKKLFEPAGMSHSLYGHKKELIKNRAAGYQPTASGIENADYLSMTLPYAAGSLMSTVDDLAKWQQALNDNKFISEDSKQLAWANYTLNNGEHINYGYGWGPNDINGNPSIEHGGGIFGYTTMGIYVPDHNVYVAILTNSSGSSPTDNAVKVAAMAIGNPYPKVSNSVALSQEQLEKWTGAYEFEDGTIRFITLDKGQLYSKRKGGNKFKIYPSSPTSFFFEDGLISYDFSEKNYKKTVFFKNRIATSTGIEANVEPPKERVAIKLAPEILKQYEGKFELQPGFIIEVTSVGEKIFAQATGQPQFEIFAEREDHFFLTVVEANVVFTRNDLGEVVTLTLHQNGMQMPGKKL